MKIISRSEAIDGIRKELLKLTDKDHSACEVASQKGIFCHGFKQDSTRELVKKYQWLFKTAKIRSREDLEKYANLWQIARQEVHGMECACDVQTLEYDTCRGWDTFSDVKLAEFYTELCGDPVLIDDGGIGEVPPCP